MQKVIILSGGFDPVHIGHIRMFKEAKELGDIVIVGANSDSWLCRKKGKPFMREAERIEILEGFKYIDYVYFGITVSIKLSNICVLTSYVTLLKIIRLLKIHDF